MIVYDVLITIACINSKAIGIRINYDQVTQGSFHVKLSYGVS